MMPEEEPTNGRDEDVEQLLGTYCVLQYQRFDFPSSKCTSTAAISHIYGYHNIYLSLYHTALHAQPTTVLGRRTRS